MAISINSCLKPSHPPIPSPPQLQPSLTAKVINWRSTCVSTAAACVVIGFSGIGFDGGAAMASDQYLMEVAAAPAKGKAARWSDGIRKCPPWHVNSLENVMPENLPRLSDRRRSDGFVLHRSAPELSDGRFGYNGSCYLL